MTDLDNAEYTLYSSPFSLYSMMARHTIQLGRVSQTTRPPKSITLHFINHGQHENLKEEYLKVNPKGQVPAMTGNVLEQPLTDSISISLHLAEKHYPALLPTEHAAVIRDLLQRFHSIYGQSFSNPKPTAEMKKFNPSPVEKILERTDISPEYRKLLEVKLKLYVPLYFFGFGLGLFKHLLRCYH
jgi:glutathione S-transferase